LTYLDELLTQHRDELAFVALFGSMAQGNWSYGGDYDVLIGLHDDNGKRLLDRVAEFTPSVALNVDVFPYSRSKWQRMFHDFHPPPSRGPGPRHCPVESGRICHHARDLPPATPTGMGPALAFGLKDYPTSRLSACIALCVTALIPHPERS
jgi:predicted nucleotidyltransferase